jgi:hypothetical protein
MSDFLILTSTFVVWLIFAIELAAIPLEPASPTPMYTELTESRHWSVGDHSDEESSKLLSPRKRFT